MRRLWIILALAVSSALSGTAVCSANALPSRPLEETILWSQAVVQGRLTGRPVHMQDTGPDRAARDSVVVDKVFLGPARVGQTLRVFDLSELPVWLNSRVNEAPPRKGDSVATYPVVLFLYKPRNEVWGRSASPKYSNNRWGIVAYGSGVRWLVKGTVYRYQQVDNPGPYYLFRDAVAPKSDDLYKLIGFELRKRAGYYSILGIHDPKKKIAELQKYLASCSSESYYADALEQLAKMGKPGKSVLRQEAERPGLPKERQANISYVLRGGRFVWPGKPE